MRPNMNSYFFRCTKANDQVLQLKFDNLLISISLVSYMRLARQMTDIDSIVSALNLQKQANDQMKLRLC